MERFKYLQNFICFAMFWFSGAVSIAAEQMIVPVSSGEEITVEHFPAKGKYLMLWFAPEYGLRETHRSLANKLGEQHIEVWLSNLAESLFMPNGTRSIRQLDGQHVADMITYAHQMTGKKIVVAGDSYASVIALRGAHRWQERKIPDPYLIGGVLFSPYTYAAIPQLGQSPTYLPIVSATNIPLMIYQAQNSPITGQFNTLKAKLQQHGSPLYTRFTPGLMSLFYQQDAAAEMQAQARLIPVNLRHMLALLEKHPVPNTVIPLKKVTAGESGIDIHLKAFRGNMTPTSLELPDTRGQIVRKENFNGKIILINFWATWCPPCIEEIPSLNRLKHKMQDLPFELISINYAEDKNTILRFMQKVHVNFPVLLDHNGSLAQQWKVISYPSTFIIDPEGRIRYGVNAAIEWDHPEVITKLKALLR